MLTRRGRAGAARAEFLIGVGLMAGFAVAVAGGCGGGDGAGAGTGAGGGEDGQRIWPV